MNQPVALITGGARGLGRSIALAYAKKKYAVALNYRSNKPAVDETKNEIETIGAACDVFQADVSSSEQVKKMMDGIQSKWGRLDVLVNNAGLSIDRKLDKMTDDEWRKVVDVNLTGPFFCIREAATLMKPAKKGSIVNIVSYLVKRPAVGAANYSASKAGLLSLTESAALELAPYNIRVNAVMPGFHVTDMNREVWKRFEDSIRRQHLLKELPRIDDAGEFVASISELRTVTGQMFPFESRLL